MKRTKIQEMIFLIICYAIIVAPGITTNVLQNQISEFDNTSLPEFPAIDSTTFTSDVENYLSYRVGFRELFITSYQIMCDVLWNTLTHPLYVYGKNGYIYDTSDLTDYQHLDVDPHFVNHFADYLLSIERLCEEYDCLFVFFYIPNKETIIPEFFPEGYNVKNQPNRSDIIVQKLSEEGINCIDVRKSFLSIKERVPLYNVKYDSGHWNANGAYIANKVMNSYLNRFYPEMGEFTKDEFTFSEKKEHFLMQSFFPIEETVPWYSLSYDDSIDDSNSYFTQIVASQNEYAFHFINPNKVKKPKILIIGDSYMGGFNCYEYYKKHCSELLMLHKVNRDNIAYYVSSFNPDIVIFEAVERTMESLGQSSRVITKSSTDNTIKLISSESVVHIEDCLHDEFVKVTGFTKQMEDGCYPAMIYGCISDSTYYPIYNRETGEFTFSIRKTDIQTSQSMDIYGLYVE